MGNPKGFLEVERKVSGYRPTNERIRDFSEVEQSLDEQDRKAQASRCMDCGVPFCQWGCPVRNISRFNGDLPGCVVYNGSLFINRKH